MDGTGQHIDTVGYVLSENFVVATRRVKHAMKNDIPSTTDHISKLVHIGKATIEKLANLRMTASEEGVVLQLPDELNHIEKVSQMQVGDGIVLQTMR